MKKTSISPLTPAVWRKPKGFALVATILLMVLLSLVTVGMLNLSTTSLRSSARVDAMAEARSNARMALMIAIGELQKELGPDQRISMTANQRNGMSPNDNGATSSAVAGNMHWTGVYKSWPSSDTARPTPIFRSWLISGSPSLVSTENAPDLALPQDNSTIELVGAGTVGPSAAEMHVRVPVVKVGNGPDTTGQIAWWIGDQGVKAALATPSLSASSSLGDLRNNLQAAPRNAVQLATTGTEEETTNPFQEVKVNDPRLPLITSWQQAAHLTASPAAPKQLFHDISAFSTGLLTNVRKGGFRKDLSMKMETYATAPDLTVASNVLYTVNRPLPEPDGSTVSEIGINFMELWSYYQLYKELKYGETLNYTTSGSVSGAYLQTKDSIAGISNDLWDRFKHPITINYQVIFSFEVAPYTENVKDADGNIQTLDHGDVLWLNFDPIVTLWNPLDVAVDIPKHAQYNYLYEFWVIPYDINVKINGGPEIVCSLINTSNKKNDANFLRLNAGVAENLTFKPGEVIIISQEGTTSSAEALGSGVGGFQGINGKKGFNYGGGTRLPLRTYTGSLIKILPSDTITYSATPNSYGAGEQRNGTGGNSGRHSLTHTNLSLGGRGGLSHGLISVDSRWGYSRAQIGQEQKDLNNMPNPLDIWAKHKDKDEITYPEVYPKIEDDTMTRKFTGESLANDKMPFMIHTYSVKTEQQNISGSRMFARFNPRAYAQNFYDLSKKERSMMPYEPEIKQLLTFNDAPLDQLPTGRGSFGSSFKSGDGSSFVTTHSVPRQPIVSLAAFQNSFANGFNMASRPNTIGSASLAYPLLPQISHAIGNSLAPSVIPSDQTDGSLAGSPHPLADHSYLANRELWDDYFFSGITPQATPAFAKERDQKTVALDFFKKTAALPVVRYLPELGDLTAVDLVKSFFTEGTSTPTQDSISKVASHLRVDGMFNVNSTSVQAWKAVLGSLKDRQIVVRDENGEESAASADGNTPVASGGAPRDSITEDESTMSADQWYGRRTLSDSEITSLAEGIVKEIRKRGPFLSLADFVNRRIVGGTAPLKNLAKSGAIQSALDSEDVAVNKNQNKHRAVSDASTDRFAFPEAEEGAMNYGAPSVVKQGDILTPIAPILSARSDSFIIRAYGESLDSSGVVAAQAWCEAVVERSRDYMDPADAPEILPSDLTRNINRELGRRFNLILFRWLSPKEI